MKTSFDIHIRDRLNDKRGNWRELAAQSGISYSWLSKFARGCIENPGLRTLERLDAALRPDIFGSAELAEASGAVSKHALRPDSFGLEATTEEKEAAHG